MTEINLKEWVRDPERINTKLFPRWEDDIRECIIGYALIKRSSPTSYVEAYAKKYGINYDIDNLKSKTELDALVKEIVSGSDNFINWIEKDLYMFLVDEGIKELAMYVVLNGFRISGLCYGHCFASDIPSPSNISDPYFTIANMSDGEIKQLKEHFKFVKFQEYGDGTFEYISTQLPRNLHFAIMPDAKNELQKQRHILGIYINMKSVSVLELFENRKRMTDCVVEILKYFARYGDLDNSCFKESVGWTKY